LTAVNRGGCVAAASDSARAAIPVVSPHSFPWHPVELFDLLQWPAMLVTIAAAWLVGSRARARREWGFRLFLASNVLWIAWGWHDRAYALILLQVGLAFMNVRGLRRNDPDAPPAPGG
jgi:hypothetical protein